MDESQTRDAAKAFFDEFVEAFASFDGSVIAQRYQAPYLARHADGTTDVFDSIDDIAGYFQRIVDGYRGRGCTGCRYRELEVEAIGADSILGTVTWELLRKDGSVLATWREAYALSSMEGRLKAFASIDHSSQAFERTDMDTDEQQIRDLVTTWMEATKAGDTAKVLDLMTEDVVFLVAGNPPMRKADFAAAQKSMAGMKFDGRSDIQEVKVLGDWAFMWTKLRVVATPAGGDAMAREGHTLTILRKENGKWRLARDANLLGPPAPLTN